MNRKQQLSIFLIFAVSMIIYCVAASPDALVNTNLEPEYWIHLDPVINK
jgi:hypothetical protein